MKPIPLPVRVAAGLAVTAVEQARTLPAKLAGLPVTVASQALQVSMRVQQQVTELAIRGDEVLSALRPVEETPEWATFDEDLDADSGADVPDTPAAAPNGAPPGRRTSAFDRVVDDEPVRRNGFRDTDADPDPWAAEERALAAETETRDLPREPDHPTDSATDRDTDGTAGQATDATDGAGGAAADVVDSAALAAAENYDQLSLPQLRARLRRFSLDELTGLLAYERAHGNRPSFVGMLTRRIATVRNSGE